MLYHGLEMQQYIDVSCIMYYVSYRLKSVSMYRYKVKPYRYITYLDVSWLVLMIYNQFIVHCSQPTWYI